MGVVIVRCWDITVYSTPFACECYCKYGIRFLLVFELNVILQFWKLFTLLHFGFIVVCLILMYSF